MYLFQTKRYELINTLVKQFLKDHISCFRVPQQSFVLFQHLRHVIEWWPKIINGNWMLPKEQINWPYFKPEWFVHNRWWPQHLWRPLGPQFCRPASVSGLPVPLSVSLLASWTCMSARIYFRWNRTNNGVFYLKIFLYYGLALYLRMTTRRQFTESWNTCTAPRPSQRPREPPTWRCD